MQRVTGVKYLRDYDVELTFRNGDVRVADLKQYVGGDGVFKPLAYLGYFSQVKINEVGNSIEWPNGADFCPDVLWEISKPIGHNTFAPDSN
jgi:hypothetical protein